MVDIIRGSSSKPVSSKRLADYFEQRKDIQGTLYIGYPIIGTAQGGYQIDALLISHQHGVIIFHIDEGQNYDLDIEDIQDESINKLQSKLLQYKELSKKRNLMVEMTVVTYAPAWQKYPDNIDIEDYPILINEADLQEFIEDCHWEHSEYYEKLNSVIQAVTTIRKKDPRSYVVQENSKGAKLKRLEDSIANLDENQNKAVLETFKGVQRIRGLAGSGKTIVLALKVAYLHATHPDWTIAVTFNTRSLKDQYKDLITRFTYEHKNAEPDWDKVKIIHAWGSPKMEGIYYEICKRHNVEYLDFKTAKRMTLFDEDPFEVACTRVYNGVKKFEQYYDVILIDEAQDFSKYFIRLCYEIIKADKRLVYAYDELQSLDDKVMDSPEIIFGNNSQGKPKVTLENLPNEPQQDIVLSTCYRNSRPILASAHGLGFGIYSIYQRPIQMFDNAKLWLDIGYEVAEGELEDGKWVKLIRTSQTSPQFLEEHSPIDDLISFHSFDSDQDQMEWLVEQIEKNLNQDELRYKDIMVIHPIPLSTRNATGRVREMLFEKQINSHLVGVTSSRDEFFQENSIAFTGIYRAKGNEAAMVYVINAQECLLGSKVEIAKKRNILFTAMTRSKAWLRVIGYGGQMQWLKKEFEQMKSKEFSLEFTYPTEEDRKQMKQIYRYDNQKERKLLDKQIRNLQETVKLIKEGKLQKEDLPSDLLEQLQELSTND
ncbi:MAG: DEAD/DEAH box helicase [Microcystaceae cyanobacterium]